jgi:anion-transporting  ArsA/GET3 family ATPase
MSTLAAKRFILVTGKGGVGKTTICAAQSLALSAGGQRVLVAMCNAKERLSTMLGTAPIGADIVQVADRVWAVNMVPERALPFRRRSSTTASLGRFSARSRECKNGRCSARRGGTRPRRHRTGRSSTTR